MRIAYLLTQFPVPSEAFASLEVRMLAECGHSVEVFCLRSPHPQTERMVKERGLQGIQIHSASGLAPGRGHDALGSASRALREPRPLHKLAVLRYASKAAKLSKAILERNFDIVHLYWGHTPSIVGELIKERRPKQVVTVALRAYDLHMKLATTRRLLSRADWCFVIAQASVPLALEAGAHGDKLSVIYDGADVAHFERLLVEPVERNPLTVLSVGRLEHEKGFDLVLKAFALALESAPEMNLRIAGEGPDKGEIERLASELGVRDKVSFLGHIAQDKLFEEMRRCGIFIMLSRQLAERLPNVVKEAALARAPVITSNTIGTVELVPGDEFGCVVDVEDYRTAGERLALWACSPDVAARSADNLYRHVRDNFDIRSSVAKYVQVWEGLL